MTSPRRSGDTGARSSVLGGVLTCVVEIGVVLLLAITPFAFGCVHKVSYTAAEVLVFALMALWAVRTLVRCVAVGPEPVPARRTPLPLSDVLRSPVTYLCGFLVVAGSQTIPLPRPFVALLSPRRVAVDCQFCELPLSTADDWGLRQEGPEADQGWSVPPVARGARQRLPITVSRRATRTALLKAIAYGSIFLLVTGCLSRESPTRRLVGVILCVGTGLAVLGIYGHVHWGGRIYGFVEPTYEAAPFGPYACRSHFAGYVAMVVPIAAALAIKHLALGREERRRRSAPDAKSRLGRGYALRNSWLDRLDGATSSAFPVVRVVLSRAFALACLLASGAMVSAIFMSRSRGGVLAFGASASVFVGVALAKGRAGWRSLAVVGLVLALLAIGVVSGGRGLLTRLAEVDLDVQRPGSRPSLWLPTFRMWLDFPVTGVGLGCFQHVFPMYKPAYFGDHGYLRAHCDYLQALAEVGLPGGLLLAGALAAVLVPAVRSVLTWPLDARTWPLVGVLSSCTAILAHSVVDFNLQIPANAILFAVILGLVHNMAHHVGVPLDGVPSGRREEDGDGRA